MDELSTISNGEKAAELRAYAKEQGRVARALKGGMIEPSFYRVEKRGEHDVRLACHRNHLADEEVQRQINEAVKHAVQARADANREATEVERQGV
jgi:hypothetical protein